MHYEIYNKDSVGKRDGVPVTKCYVLATAMEQAVKLSKGEKIMPSWDSKGNSSNVPVPFAYVVVERAERSKIRGWGIGGKWFDAVDCKRCQNSGIDQNAYIEPCYACKGASYRPKV